MAGTATCIAWSTAAIPHLKSENSKIHITEMQGSLIASLNYIGMIVGFASSPFLMDRLGRKISLLLVGLSQIAGWMLINLSQSVHGLYLARIISGISDFSFIVSMIYAGEIADKKIRGTLSSIQILSFSLGIFYMITLGAFLPYETVNKLGFLIPLIFLITFLFMPETPYFLLIQGRDEEAMKTLMKLKNTENKDDIKLDLERMKTAILESQENNKSSFRELFSTRGSRSSFLALLFLKVTKQLSGITAIVVYGQRILDQSGFSLGSNYLIVILCAGKVFAGVIATSLIDILGRKMILLISALGTSLALTSVGVFFFMHTYLRIDVTSFNWLPFAGLMTHVITFNVGLAHVPAVFVGEVFSIKVKVLAAAFSLIAEAFVGFIVILGFIPMTETIGIYGTFWFFAVMCVVGPIISNFIVPETKGKYLEDIQIQIHRRSSRQTIKPLLFK